MAKARFFHASPRRFHIGKVLGGPSDIVFVTSSERPHYTIAQRAREEGWHVYEVQPIGRVNIGRCYDEGWTERVEVIRYVGNARGIGRNGRFSKYHYSLSKDIKHKDVYAWRSYL